MYSWEGMKKISKEKAIELFKAGNSGMVFKLYDDNTEAAIENLEDFDDENFNDGDYGIEK